MADFESTGGIDPEAFASDLFPKESSSEGAGPDSGGEGAISSPEPTSSPAPSTSTPVPDAAPDAVTQEVWDAMPKSWRKEMEAEWKAAPVGVRKYVHEREQQVTQGISSYKQAADQWNQVTSPFTEILKEYPNANVSEILATLANNHIQMVRASPAERRNHALALARGYGVDLTPAQAAAVADTSIVQGQAADQGFTPAQIAELRRSFGPVVDDVRRTSEFVNKQLEQAATAEVDKFFSDTKNEFVNEVADDILLLMKQGRASGLAEAYEMAVLRNPSVKARYIAGLVTKSAPPPSNAPKLPNVKSSATPISRGKPKTMDDTFAGVLEKHFGSTST